MEGTEIVLVAFFLLLAVCVAGVGIAAFMYWKDMRTRKMEATQNQMLDLMENFMWAFDRELCQVWEYILSSKSEDSKGEPK